MNQRWTLLSIGSLALAVLSLSENAFACDGKIIEIPVLCEQTKNESKE